MIHPTFRSLDDAPKLVGFTIRQWAALIAAGITVLAIVDAAGLHAKAAVTLLTFTVGLPAALTYVSEGGGLRLGVLLLDICRWRLRAKTLPAAGAGGDARRPSAARLLGVDAITEDGLLIGSDGIHVRYVETEAVNPLVMDGAEAERASGAFLALAARLGDGQALQLYAHAEALDVEELLALEAHRCELAAGACEDAGEPGRAAAVRALAGAQEQTIRGAPRPSRRCGSATSSSARGLPRAAADGRAEPGGEEQPSRARRSAAAREALRHAEGVRSDLEAMGLAARMLDGEQVLDLLHARFDPDARDRGTPAASFLHADALASAAGDGCRARPARRSPRRSAAHP